MMKVTTRTYIAAAALMALLLPPCLSCSDNDVSTASVTTDGGDGTVNVGLTLRAESEGDNEYELGSTYENYIDIAGGDYRIYFFENKAEGGNDVLIAEFDPESVLPVEGSDYTEYTVQGQVEEELTAYTDFKVMILANWGEDNYPTVIAGETTIDDVCQDSNGVYDAFVSSEESEDAYGSHRDALMPSASKLIPFFGLREFTGITWKENQITILPDVITLLRAMAKVEVIVKNDEDDEENYIGFDKVLVRRYNSKGYCAPTGVYVRGDYDHDYTYSEDFTSKLHLVGGANDTDDKAIAFYKVQDRVWDADNNVCTQYETWRAYVPEYDNITKAGTDDDDYSYITVAYGNVTDNIYFATYTSGKTDNDDADNRKDIWRNYLYRYYVTIDAAQILVQETVLPWVERKDDISF